MNYKRIYDNIVANRKNNRYNGYTERHHIIPKSLGGSDALENLVNLSAKEHFICHLLLTKIYEKNSNEYHKMIFAFLMMLTKSNNQNRYITSKKYETLKVVRADYLKTLVGEKTSQHNTMWICNRLENTNKKIKITDAIPKGWEKGRLLKTNRKCKYCGTVILKKISVKRNSVSYCSDECKIAYKNANHYKVENTVLYGKETEFIELYNIHKSINKSLKLMGFVGGGGYYIWAKDVLAKQAIIV